MDQIIYKIPTKDEIQNEKKCVHKCFTCEKVFTSRSSFNEHNKQHHSETCSKCGKIFINLEKIHLKMVLKRHERICDFMDFDPMEVDNMNCKVCGRFFNSQAGATSTTYCSKQYQTPPARQIQKKKYQTPAIYLVLVARY